MKNYHAIVCILILFIQLSAVKGQNQNNQFKPGDWFECEMEFEGVPVFRNHTVHQGSEPKNTQLISLRFTCSEIEDGQPVKWSYKVLRYKEVGPTFRMKKYRKMDNVFDFDSWYPDFFMEDIDSIRKSLTGTISIDDHGTILHDYRYDVQFNLRNFLPYKSGSRGLVSYYVTRSIPNNNNTFPMLIEKTSKIIFNAKNYRKEVSDTSGLRQLDYLGNAINSERKYLIRGMKEFGRTVCTAYFLFNDLPYAFMDQHQHKVFAITNASFPLPTKAKIEIVDKRTEASQKPNSFNNIIRIASGNPAFVMDESGIPGLIIFDSRKAEKTYALKCGTSFSFFPGSRHAINLFLEPGDSIQVTLMDDSVIIRGSDNSSWWNNNPELNAKLVEDAAIDAEFKSYLQLLMLLKMRYFALDSLEPEQFKTSILDFFTLKSYYYTGLPGQGMPGIFHFVRQYNKRKDYLINAVGSPTKKGFDYEYYKSIIQNTDFPLYFELYRTLTRDDSYNQIGKDIKKYENFKTVCGDTILKKYITQILNGYKALQVGEMLPFQDVLTENNQKISILPARGKYGLVFLYRETDRVDEFKLLVDSIPDFVQTVSYRVNHDLLKFSDGLLSYKSLNDADHLELYGHPSQTRKLDKYIIESQRPMLLLYNDKGRILLNESFERVYGNDIGSYKTKILNAIDDYEDQSKNETAGLLLLIAISVIATGLLVMMIYRMRINRLKKRNAQQQLLQELKLKSVQSQLNPHFIFNALNSIQQLINSAQSELANQYLVGFSNLLRGVLKNADKKLVPLSDELEMVNSYMELEKLRLDFKFRIDVDSDVSTELTEIPYMLFQPLIENSVKHGISKIPGGREINIKIEENGSDIVIRIRDNGPGFGHLTLDQCTEKGKGLVLIQEKIDNIYGNDGRLELSSGESGKGAEVIITLKIG
ncbi:sensor histidine kinase [Saccharicrinis sp. FJH62]|uniref:sensor histidine kinase n=1 Tax=Saccharicrinis sp. FJH62 TaxID=3344657 RepID=UPI0035D45690